MIFSLNVIALVKVRHLKRDFRRIRLACTMTGILMYLVCSVQIAPRICKRRQLQKKFD